MIDVFVFDLDDTLYPEREFVLSGFNAVSSWLFNHKGISGFFDLAWQFYERGHRGNVFNLVLEKLKINCNPSFMDQLVEVYRSHLPSLDLFEDASWAIDFFQNKKMAIITDGYFQTQVRKVEALGIKDKFACILYTDEFGRDWWKPSPLPYQKVMDFFRCEGRQCLYVADNPSKDFISAKRLGWHTIRIRREKGEYRNIEVCRSYRAACEIETLYGLRGLAA
jgi:putative hydrolase of the HAD superfamily